MKNMRKATGILLTATGLLAAGNSARAQNVIQAPAGQAYTIANNVSASAVTEVTYQWYRDNSPIAGATKESYTVPAVAAYGDNVAFYRMATAQECAGIAEKKSNIITITFTGYVAPVGCNLIIGGVCWADFHIDNPKTFATRADMNTKFYQWNRLTALSATDSIISDFNAVVDSSETWTVNPCPNGWRLPTQAEYQQLQNSGTTWADANTRGNLIPGRFYGYNHTTCTLPSNMRSCVFFPASGYRSSLNSLLYSRGVNGYSWSSTQNNYTFGYYLSFDKMESRPAITGSSKANGLPIRCVQ